MRSKFLTGAAILALATPVLMVAGPAAPQTWQYYGNATAGAPDFTAGMADSTLAAPSPFWGTGYCGYYSRYPCAPGDLYAPRHYRSRR
jgi:hypothetical protein